MVDIHCHIIAGVDDGARDWETSIEMCRIAKADGIEHIVATPHANDEYAYDRDKHEESLARLREIVGGIIQLSLGCDFHFSYDNIQDALKYPRRYCIGNTPYLLVEFNDYAIPPGTAEILARLMEAGVRPIITHPERNPILQRNPRMVVDWVKIGALVQVTANSITGRWGTTAQKVSLFLMQNQAVHVLATDAHGTRDRRPQMSEARDQVAKALGQAYADSLVEQNPAAIVEGKPLAKPHEAE